MKLFFSQNTSPEFNLAAEEYLFAQTADDVLFLYINAPSVIVGSNQVVQNEVNELFCAENNIKVLRRMSGGGAVYHDLGNLNYSFITNRIDGKSTLDDSFLQPVVEVLKSINIPVQIGQRKDLWLPGNFKISGTASHISKFRELHHGTLLFNTNLLNLEQTLNAPNKNLSLKGTASVPSAVINIFDYLCGINEEMNMQQFCLKMLNAFEVYYNIQKCDFVGNQLVDELITTKYRQISWNFKK